jgi:protein TonB
MGHTLRDHAPIAVLAMCAHGAALAALWSGSPAQATQAPRALPMQVRMLAASPAATPAPAAKPMVKPKPAPTPPKAARPLAAPRAPASPTAPSAASAPSAVSVPAVADAAPTAPRFDADYLHNPAPAYPAMARRNGEEGRVQLSVRVSAQGRAEQVEVRHSSGYARLDEAALATVRQWRFVPARRGEEAVAASVLVPIVFRLENAS